jgi:hypothetical protein
LSSVTELLPDPLQFQRQIQRRLVLQCTFLVGAAEIVLDQTQIEACALCFLNCGHGYSGTRSDALDSSTTFLASQHYSIT